MKCISKLSRLPITVQNLQKTGIGRVVNSLRKYEGNLGESAKSLVIQWKNVVKIEESENFYQKDENSDEEHQDISSSNENEELQINQSITSSVATTSYYNNYNNEPDLKSVNIDDSSDHDSSHRRHHDKSKYKKSKKDKDRHKERDKDKRKPSISTSTDDQGDEHVSKKIKKEHHKHESVKYEIATTSHHKNHYNTEDNIKKDKKSSHSDKKKINLNHLINLNPNLIRTNMNLRLVTKIKMIQKNELKIKLLTNISLQLVLLVVVVVKHLKRHY